MKIGNLIAVCGVLLGSGLSADLWACKVSHVKNALEITDRADLIVLAKAVGPDKNAPKKIKFNVLKVLKGDARSAPGIVRAEGQTDRYEGPNEKKPPYDWVRPGGQHGNCFALDYKKGAQYLLFLNKEGEDYTPYWAPLAATNEEVSGKDDPWFNWVTKRLSTPNK